MTYMASGDGCKTILVVSSSIADSTHDLVTKAVTEFGWEPVVFLADKVLEGRAEFELSIGADGRMVAEYEGVAISPDDIAAAWYWKVGQLHLYENGDLAKRLSIDNEMRHVNASLWGYYPEDVWLTSPRQLSRAEEKLTQLSVARRIGFSIPETLVTNKWATVREFHQRKSPLAAKMFKGLLAGQNGKMRATFTTLLGSDEIDSLEQRALPYPGMFQPFIPKFREWRVTAVGDEVFGVAIETAPEAADDWRRLQLTEAVRFEPADLPRHIEKLCIKYLREQNLQYGAFDLIETGANEFVFLECNPSGQFGWIEIELGTPISHAIARQLDSIGRARSRRRGDQVARSPRLF